MADKTEEPLLPVKGFRVATGVGPSGKAHKTMALLAVTAYRHQEAGELTFYFLADPKQAADLSTKIQHWLASNASGT